MSAIGRVRSGGGGKNGRQPTATRPLLAAPAVAPAPTGEVTAGDRDPASTGRAEVLAPARMWWNNGDGAMKDVPRDAFWSWGLRESFILVVPSLDLVAARAGPKGWAKSWSGRYSVLEPFFTLLAGAGAVTGAGPAA